MEVWEKVKSAVTDLVGAEDPVESLEEHPLIRKVLHKYAKAKHSAGFGLPGKLYSDNAKCELLGEFTGMPGTPPTVLLTCPRVTVTGLLDYVPCWDRQVRC